MQAKYLLLQYCIWYWLVCCRVWLPSWRPLVTSSLSWTPSTPTTTLVKSCWSSFESSSLLMRKWRKLCWRQVCCPGMCGTVCHITVYYLLWHILLGNAIFSTNNRKRLAVYTLSVRSLLAIPHAWKQHLLELSGSACNLRHSSADSTKITSLFF